MKLNINNTKDFEIIASYLSGEMSNEEAFQFEKHVESLPENKHLITEMKNQWEKIGKYHEKKQIDPNKAWNKLYTRLDNDNLVPEDKNIQHYLVPVWVGWAASIIVIMSIVGLSFYSLFDKKIDLISLQTGNDSNTLVQTLTDGSVIYLANNTTFSYPTEFDTESRKVNLDGEAFFDITSNPEQPFIIETEETIIEVLGTSFNVKSEKNSQFELIVEKGKVRVTLKSNPTETTIVLPGEKITSTGNQFNKIKTDNLLYSSWKKRRMQFKDESLSNIVRVINKNYNSNIHLTDQQLNDRKLTVTFYNNSLKTITELICLSLNLSMEVKPDSTIILKSIDK
ncbi:MAG: FecR family protein [Tenuifilaceae bacterium]